MRIRYLIVQVHKGTEVVRSIRDVAKHRKGSYRTDLFSERKRLQVGGTDKGLSELFRNTKHAYHIRASMRADMSYARFSVK